MQIEFLNGLRGICALWVVGIHELMFFLPMTLVGISPVPDAKHLQHLSGPWEEIMSRLPFAEGNFAVCIFFLLSAFVMSIRYWQQEKRENGYIINAAVRRYIRLTGPVFGAMLIAWLLAKAGWMRNLALSEITLTNEIIGSNGALVFQPPMTVWEFLQTSLYNVYIAGFPEGAGRRFDFVLWTMPVELKGSLMALAGLALLGNIKRRDVFYAALCLFAGSNYLLAFPLGVWLADISFAHDREQMRRFLGRFKWLPYLCLIFGMYLGLFRDTPGPAYEWLRGILTWEGVDRIALCHTAGGALLLYAVLQLGWLQRLLDCRPLVFLGHHSFSLYLAHVPVYCSFQAAVFMHFFKHGMGYGKALLLSFLLALPVIALVVWILDRFFDRPAQKLARRFAGWLLDGKK